MLKVTDDIQGLDMSFELSEKDIAVLATAVKQEWFDILQRLMENEVKRLNVKLINTGGSNPNEILANHAIAKGAAQFYAGFIKKLREVLEIDKYNNQTYGTAINPEQPPYPEEFVQQPEEDN